MTDASKRIALLRRQLADVDRRIEGMHLRAERYSAVELMKARDEAEKEHGRIRAEIREIEAGAENAKT